MGNKLILVMAFMLFVVWRGYGQNMSTKKKEPIFYDATDSSPVFRFVTQNDTTKFEYYYGRKDTITSAVIPVDFVGGYRSFSAYCDKMYYSNFSEYDYREVNIRIPYAILFDNNLKMKEVHVLKMMPPHDKLVYNASYDYNSLIKRILYSTDGKWIKKEKGRSSWYIYVGFFHLK